MMYKVFVFLTAIFLVSNTLYAQDQTIYGRLNLMHPSLGNTHFPYTDGSVYITSFTGEGQGSFIFRNYSGSSYTNRLVIKQDGKVGIGLDNPDSKFVVNGRGRFGYGPIYIDWTSEEDWLGNSNKWAGYIGFNAFRNNDEPKDYFWGQNKYTDKAVIEGSNFGFRFLFRNTASSDSNGQHQLGELLRITDLGNVGIGTPSPDYKLDVLGTIRANEVKVATGWSDFVFKPEYDLPTLQEVENFIDQNGHLPDIPSAEEVMADGISLGEMDAKLLQKIEELTLYVIELKKENENQAKEIQALKAKQN